MQILPIIKKSLWALGLVLATSSFVLAEAPLDLKKESKIVGGTKAPLGAWPSTVALLQTAKLNQGNYKAQFCAGTLISSKWVLTAAHCMFDGKPARQVSAASIKALLGTSDLAFGGTKYDVKRIVVHPDYDPQSEDSDIALLELRYNAGIRTIRVSADDAPVGLLATVVGWGAADKNEEYFPEELYEVELPIVDRAVCENIYDAEFTQNMICAGYKQGGKDTCKADSGGPLMGIQYGEYVQIGITSWGVGCAQPEFYGVYTRLSQFDNWINFYAKNPITQGGGYDSWSRFYSSDNDDSGGGSLFFLLLPLALIIPVRRRLKVVAK